MSRKANSALTLAYNCVINIGWNHARLRNTFGITFPTLRHIRNGERVKVCTDEYCMRAFVSVLKEEYETDLRNVKEGCANMNRAFREIFFAMLDIRR